ncbi:MAG TPA: hypothetical protein DDW49_11880 [Deltaproteobacteria bacterium]|nr:hypothetical protein [Deltaproteobacteria bacterium]
MNVYFLLKVLISSLVIAGISEISKRNTFMGALLASLPLTSLLAILWLYYDTHDIQKINDLCHGIFWIVIPSLAFFLILPCLLKSGVRFGLAMGLSIFLTAIIYNIFIFGIKKCGINL